MGILALGGGGYLGIKQYQSYRVEKLKKEQKLEVLVETQKETLEAAQREIENLKEENISTVKKQQILEEKIKTQAQQQGTVSQNLSISSIEINPYLIETPLIICYDEYRGLTLGSGSIWNLSNFGGSIVMTNKHIIDVPECSAQPYDGDKSLSTYKIYLRDASRLNSYTDVSFFPFYDLEGTRQKLNSNISKLPLCPTKMAVGSPVVVIGFPAFGVRLVDLYDQGFLQRVASQIVTDGIISGYDTTVVIPQGKLPHQNYFISATVDSGNSGGIVLSKDENGLCVLGIPTWLSVGNFETQGLVQNIHNIFYNK